jgi:hypothetical protein
MIRRVWPLAALLVASAAVPTFAAKKKAKPAAAEESAAAPQPEEGGGTHRKRVEAYLAKRLKKIQDAHAARIDFSIKDEQSWESFWEKAREERKTFEVRTARQTVDLFSTLEVIEPRDHATTIADFEKMRANMFKSFESQQKQKVAEYFAAREARWKEFVAAQERERVAFALESDANWQDDKLFLRSSAEVAALPAGALPGSSKP